MSSTTSSGTAAQRTAAVDAFVRQYNTLARAAVQAEQGSSGTAADYHIKLSGELAKFLRQHGWMLNDADVQFLRSETVARCMHALLLRSMELSGFGELALSLSATRHLNQDIENARRRLESGRQGSGTDELDDMSDPRSKTDGLYEYMAYEEIDVTLEDLPGYREQQHKLLQVYYTLVDESQEGSNATAAATSTALYGRRPQTRAGPNAILYGPPGTGKTVAARAVAASLHLDFVFVNSENVVSAYRSETEKNLRKLYSKMRLLIKITKRNVVLLLDEVDGLVKNRSGGSALNSGEYSLLTQFLTILEPNDGTDNDGIFSIFTTNKLSNLDDAFLRRCVQIYFGPVTERESRLRLFNKFLHDTVDTLTNDNNEIMDITALWVPGDYARFKRDVAKPRQLDEFLRRQGKTLDQFYEQYSFLSSSSLSSKHVGGGGANDSATDEPNARSRRIRVSMPLLSYDQVRLHIKSYQPVTPRDRYVLEYDDHSFV